MSGRPVPCHVCDCCEFWRNNPPEHRVVVQWEPSQLEARRRHLLEVEVAALEAELRRRGENTD